MTDPTASSPLLHELIMTHAFEVPPQSVFEAWSRAEHVAQWFTPAPLTTPECEVDLCDGGVFRVVMEMPDGTRHPMEARFTEVVPNERIVFTAIIEVDLDIKTTVTLAPHDGGTLLTMRQVYGRESASTQGAEAGWTQTLKQLATHMAASAEAG